MGLGSSGKTCDVQYMDDGTTDRQVPFSRLKLLGGGGGAGGGGGGDRGGDGGDGDDDELVAGTRIECSYHASGKYFPAIVSQVVKPGELYEVAYDDGYSEKNVARSSIRVVADRQLAARDLFEVCDRPSAGVLDLVGVRFWQSATASDDEESVKAVTDGQYGDLCRSFDCDPAAGLSVAAFVMLYESDAFQGKAPEHLRRANAFLGGEMGTNNNNNTLIVKKKAQTKKKSKGKKKHGKESKRSQDKKKKKKKKEEETSPTRRARRRSSMRAKLTWTSCVAAAAASSICVCMPQACTYAHIQTDMRKITYYKTHCERSTHTRLAPA